MSHELTLSDILTDPLISLVLKADGILLEDFAVFLEEASARNKRSAKMSIRGLHKAVDALVPNTSISAYA